MASSAHDFAVEFTDGDPTRADSPGKLGPLAENFSFYANFNTAQTVLRWVRLSRQGETVGWAPTVLLARRPATDMLRQPWRRRLGWVGPLARKTTLLVDTAFLAYDDASPIATVAGVDRAAVKLALAEFLKRQNKVDAVWIAEPPAEAAWAGAAGFDQFLTLPMAQVELSGCADLAAFEATLSKKRRRNLRTERETFAAAGATITEHDGPLQHDPSLGPELVACLDASAAHSELAVPYNDVLIDPVAFARQPQTALVARVAGQVVGFMSFLQDGERLMQCHGGLDYRRSHDVLAYHNLIHAGVELALRRGCRLLSMGPLNNETKRRAASVLRPIVASLWNRNPVDRVVARAAFIRNFAVYQGTWKPDAAAARAHASTG